MLLLFLSNSKLYKEKIKLKFLFYINALVEILKTKFKSKKKKTNKLKNYDRTMKE